VPDTDVLERLRQLEAEVAQLRDDRAASEPRFGRRHLITAAAGAAAGGVLASAAPAAAADGDNLKLGSTANTAPSATEVSGGHWTFNTPVTVSGSDEEVRLGGGVGATILVGAGNGYAILAGNDAMHGATIFVENATGAAIHAQTGDLPPDGTPPGPAPTIIAASYWPQTVPFGAGGQGRAHIWFEPRGEPGPPSDLEHEVGELALGSGTDIHVCHAKGTPGGWHTLLTNRTPAGTAAGVMQILDAPFRLYDSRPGRASAITGPKTKLVAGSVRVLAATQHGVAAGALAVVATIAVTQTTNASGHVAAHAAGLPDPGTSTINWFGPNQTLATTTIARLSTDGGLALRCGPSATHITVDILGWIA
jgi:hypothetical protein